MKPTRIVATLAATLITIGSLAGGANAAVLFTDLGSGVTILNSSYNLDLDNNGTTDFVLSHGLFANLMHLASTGGINSWVQDPVSGSSYPDQLPGGATIGISSNFVSSGSWNFGRRLRSGGAWLNPATGEGGGGLGYLGFRFNIGGSAHYGWAELDYSDDGLAGGTLLSYAFETNDNDSILTAVPEPTSALLCGLGALGLMLRRR